MLNLNEVLITTQDGMKTIRSSIVYYIEIEKLTSTKFLIYLKDKEDCHLVDYGSYSSLNSAKDALIDLTNYIKGNV